MLQIMLTSSLKQTWQLYLQILTSLLNHQHCKNPLPNTGGYSMLIFLFAFEEESKSNENMETILTKRKSAYLLLLLLKYSKTPASWPEGINEVSGITKI